MTHAVRPRPARDGTLITLEAPAAVGMIPVARPLRAA